MTQLHAKFFGRKAGALGICFYHTITLHSQSESFDDVRKAIYKCGYENVTVIDVSVTTERTLTSDERLYNQMDGHTWPPHVTLA